MRYLTVSLAAGIVLLSATNSGAQDAEPSGEEQVSYGSGWIEPDDGVSHAAVIADTVRVDPQQCVPPLIPKSGDRCILNADLKHPKTLRLPSDIIVDCQGHQMSPQKGGTIEDVTTPETEYLASSPPVWAVIEGCNVTIKNCDVSGYDFGIVVVSSKCPADRPNRILNNSFVTNYHSVSVFASDSTEIAGNTIATTNGVGVLIVGNSDRNHVVSNSVQFKQQLSTTVQYPGAKPLDVNALAGGVGPPLYGVSLTLPFSGDLLNIIVDRDLFQIYPQSRTNAPGQLDGADGTSFVANTATIAAGSVFRPFALIAAGDGVTDTLISQNRVSGPARNGINLSGNAAELFATPGTCSLDSSRLCLNDAHCFLPAIDTQSQGPCQGVVPAQPRDGRTYNTLLTENVVTGPFPISFSPIPPFNSQAGDAIQSFASPGTTISGNTLSGAERAGVFLNSDSRSATVTRNKIRDNGFGLIIGVAMPRPWTGSWSLNDITNNTVGVRAFSLSSELSVVGEDGVRRGNYWGYSCAQSRGFPLSLSTNPTLAKDSFAFGEPVADQNPLSAATCPQQGF